MVDNEEYYCLALSPDDLSLAQQEDLRSRRAALLNGAKWNEAEIITIKFLEGDTDLQERVRKVAEDWVRGDMANLRFDWRTDGDTDIRIAFRPGKGSWSHLGTLCRDIAQDQPTMNFGWLKPSSSDNDLRRVVLHEFGHALGLIHEHQSPEGGIKWNRAAVIKDLSGPPNNWSLEKIETNMFRRFEDVSATPVDEDSIMIYPIPNSWTLDDFSAGLNRDLSENDRLLIRREYPRR